ncbi:mitotic spindle checkpoint component mad2 [Aureobasidium sp. EXF-8845]|nr:mitotic spindle checkpoint component mad2 [Aureobasidium sp. EXF-8846]KAI4851683.1 mitotic spindle checkpoint component mad2 [Aureobasidium sp. EXF-8845]
MPPAKKESKEKNTHKLALKGFSVVFTHQKTLQRTHLSLVIASPSSNEQYRVKKYGLNMLVSQDDQVKAYIKKIMSQLNKWMLKSKISKLIIVITSKETGEPVERWQFDVQIFGKDSKKKSSGKTVDENATDSTEQASEKTDQEVQQEIQSIFRQITASVTFLPMLDGNCTFNVLVYADQDSEVPLEWGDSDAKDIQDAEKVQLRSFSTSNHKVDTLVSYRLAE